jgi:glycosyltransferase involved in cell wall biosynthesis
LPGHNNARYAALFPRLTSVVQFHKVNFSRYRLVRATQYRAWRALDRRLLYPAVSRALARRYRVLFTVDPRQIPFWSGRVVADVDDPIYTPEEIALMRMPQVKAIIMTSEKAKQTYEDLGVRAAVHVIPQGVSAQVDPEGVARVRRQFKHDDAVIVGYLAPTLTLAGDGPNRWRGGLDDLDDLIAAVEDARVAEPRLQLWLLGRPSDSLHKHAQDRSWIRLFGFVSLSDILHYVSNFDVAVYPRKPLLPPGWNTVKMAQYMACGVPIVATAVGEARAIEDIGCGVVCGSWQEFRDALVRLARSPDRRSRLGAAGRRYAAANLDWSHLVSRYEGIIREVAGEGH